MLYAGKDARKPRGESEKSEGGIFLYDLSSG